MNVKEQWVKQLNDQGINAHLDSSNVIMLETDSKDEAIKYREALADYPYSWGIKRKGLGENDQDEVLSDYEGD